MFQGLLEQILNEEAVSTDMVTQAMNQHEKIIVTYTPVTKDRENATGPRLVGVFAYGQTKASNDCIRVYEYAGDTATFVPGWKLLRLDQIKSWKPTGQTFSEPPDNLFNPDGDNTMSVVFKVTKFDDEMTSTNDGSTGPKTSDVFMTDTEKELRKHGMNLKNQLDNPIYISDLKAKKGTEPYEKGKEVQTTGPKTSEKPVDISYKDEVDKMFAPLKDKIANAKKIDLNGNKPTETPEDETVQEPEENTPEYKNEVNKMFAPLRDKIANAEKIDLSKIKDPRKRKAGVLSEIIESGRKVTLSELKQILSYR